MGHLQRGGAPSFAVFTRVWRGTHAGGKILLNNSRLWLKRGRRYGLCGPNGCGKSTLMRAIANGQLEGFPPKEELRTVYVEHDIDASESDTPVVDYVHADPILQGAPSRHLTQYSYLIH